MRTGLVGVDADPVFRDCGELLAELSCELPAAMAATGHPFILGTAYDALTVPGCDEVILEKVRRMLTA